MVRYGTFILNLLVAVHNTVLPTTTGVMVLFGVTAWVTAWVRVRNMVIAWVMARVIA